MDDTKKHFFPPQIRAGVKTFQPKETKFAEDNPKFNKKVSFIDNDCSMIFQHIFYFLLILGLLLAPLETRYVQFFLQHRLKLFRHHRWLDLLIFITNEPSV